MHIVINVLGLPFNGDTIKTQSLGGSESAGYYMAKELAKNGHRVTMFTTSQEEGIFDDVRYINAGEIRPETPLGERFHFYAQNTPHDVLITQRHPHAFRYKWASKVNLWWVHDLALKRSKNEALQQLWNVDGILTVSQFHKDQYCEAYGINPEIVFPIQNGVDLTLFDRDFTEDESRLSLGGEASNQTALIYSSRPERGLEHLVGPDGIMERLAKSDPKCHLYVCGYENTTPDTRDYYAYLWGRCDELTNVTNLGSLTKQELADVMRQCDAMVYPMPGPVQPDFGEVSCITAMECMAAGLPFISSKRGALPETCEDSGSILLEPDENGMPIIESFVEAIHVLGRPEHNGLTTGGILAIEQHEAAPRYDWSAAASMVEDVIARCMERNRSPNAVARSMTRESDIYALENYMKKKPCENMGDAIMTMASVELDELYGFAFHDKWFEHYQAYYQYEKERGVDYGPENLQGNTRFEYVAGVIGNLDAECVVLDYGCAHGHYTINLAKRFPDRQFVGVDITETNVEKAQAWAEAEGLDNAIFFHGFVNDSGALVYADEGREIALDPIDCVIAAEVVEHVGDPAHLVDALRHKVKDGGQVIITTPYGPWEAQGYEEHWPWRAHVHHFERQDLSELWGKFPGYEITAIPSGQSKFGTMLGSYATIFKEDKNQATGAIDYVRKLDQYVPQQTVSACMIVKDAEATLKTCLDSMASVVDEIVIAIDETTTDDTKAVIDRYIRNRQGIWPVIITKEIRSPLEIGFDEARNESIKDASGDWILWMDSDETLINPQNLFKYLRNNAFHGYALKQHHFAIEPLGVLKTDMPCRMFRNHRGVKFFGVVHEHPELALNEGVGYVQLLPDVEIAHNGYTTEDVRRKRFNRNINLLVRDREKYPDRTLGRFLWMRDLAQMCKYENEVTGRVSTEMRAQAAEGVKIWEELLDEGHLRMVLDGMEFYSLLTKVAGEGFEFGFVIDANEAPGGVDLQRAKPVIANFANKGHIEKLMKAMIDERVKDFEC